jgi:hypothetical protein
MHEYKVRTPEQALVYLLDCTLATVSDMAFKKSRKKAEFRRQINIAQKGIDWCHHMSVDVSSTRADDIIKANILVEEWAKQYMPEYKKDTKK